MHTTPPDPGADDQAGAPPLEAERAFLRLGVFLAESLDFRIAVVVTSDARAEAAFAERAAGQIQASGRAARQIHVDHLTDQSIADAIREEAAKEQTGAVFLRGLNVLLRRQPSDGRVDPLDTLIAPVQELNLMRDSLPALCPCPLVIWLTSASVSAFAKLALDIWSWKVATVYLTTEDSRIERHDEHVQMPMDTASSLDSAEAQDRLRALYAQLHRLEHAPLAARDRDHMLSVLNEIGVQEAWLGNIVVSKDVHTRQLQLARSVGDRKSEGFALGNLANRWAALGEPRKALELYEEALTISREIGDRRGEGTTLGNMGNRWAELGEPRKALELFEQALNISREIGDHHGEGHALGSIATSWATLGEPRKALELYEQRLVSARELGDRRWEGIALVGMGNRWAELGEPRKALELYEQALNISREIGDRRGEGSTLGNMGSRWAELGEPRKAFELYKQRLVIASELGDRRAEGITLWNMGLLHRKLGDLQRAIELMQLCVDYEHEIGHPDAEKHQQVVDQIRRELEARNTNGDEDSSAPPG